MTFSKKALLMLLLLFAIVLLFVACGEEETTAAETTGSARESTAVVTTNEYPVEKVKVFSFENDIVRAELTFEEGSLSMNKLYNKESEKDYLSKSTLPLFSYTFGDYVDGKGKNEKTVKANGGNWTLVSSTVDDITANVGQETRKHYGKRTEIVLADDSCGLQVRVIFEIYDGRSGLRFKTYLKNLSNQKIVVTKSDVFSLALPNDAHKLHYVSSAASADNPNTAGNAVWKTTAGALKPNTGRNALCVYTSGDGWWMMPETNWRTQIGPEYYGQKPSETHATYEFATTSCFVKEGVSVSTNPDSVMLTLKSGEEFDYIAVNLTVFRGDVVNGKMAAEEHFYKRFLYHDTETIINTNDWNYLNKRTTEWYKTVLIPAAKKAGIDMVMLDDLWNTNRDSITAIAALGSLESFSDMVKDEGFMLGIWYSMSGGDHNNGRDLADPEKLAEKIALVETLIKDYGMNHMMVDLTEYWQNTKETDYSSPCDNVYRKNVMVQNALNVLIDKYPEFLVKPTNEVDVFPTQGNRCNGLLHVMNNGWVVANGGAGNGSQAFANMFGYLPLSATYGDGNVDGDIAELYFYLFCRNVKLAEAPDTAAWTEHGIELMAAFNAWRGGERMKAILSTMKYPVYFGEGWDSDDQGKWASDGMKKGPFAWLQMNADRSTALLLASASFGEQRDFIADLRWLDENKTYAIADVTLTDNGYFLNRFVGTVSGKTLVTEGFCVPLSDSESGACAYVLQEVKGDTAFAMYADEDAKTYALSQSGNTLTVTVEGKVGAIASVIVVDPKTDKALTLNIAIGYDGKGKAILTKDQLLTPSEQPDYAFETVGDKKDTRLEFETLYADGKLIFSDSGSKVGGYPNDGASAGASGNDYRNVTFPKGAGEYVRLPVTVEVAGTYTVTLAMKSNENQAKAAIGQNGQAISETIDLSTGYALNRIHTLSCTMYLEKGENLIDILCVGKGAKNTSSTLSLRIDYVEVTSKADAKEAEGYLTADTVVNESLASGGKTVKLDLVGLADAQMLALPLEGGRYLLEMTFVKTPSSPVITLTAGGERHVLDLYAAVKETVTLSLTADLMSGEAIEILVSGRANASSGYDVLLDTIAVSGSRRVSADVEGFEMKVGETLDLSKLVLSENEVAFVPLGETAFGTLSLSGAKVTAKAVGTAIFRAFDKATLEYFDFTVTVTDSTLSSSVTSVITAVNQGNAERADTLFATLSESDKAKVTNYPFMKRNASPKEDDGKSGNYLDELAYVYNDGSHVREGSCPSGSHAVKFTEDGKEYAHGIGFEPTDKTLGTIYVKIPEGMTKFSVHVGLDYGMSAANMAYDQKNTVSIWVDGKELAATETIKKNAGEDRSYYLEVALSPGADYLLIAQHCGDNRICDHILLADAKFE